MVFDLRNGVSAKKVFIHTTDAVRNSSGNLSLAGTDFTGNAYQNFFGAYYGSDVVLATVDYAIVDLDFPSGTAGADVTQNFDSQANDVIASIVTDTITLTTNIAMTINEHIGRYVSIKAAAGNSPLVFARIVSNTADDIVVDQDVANSYAVAAADTIILLKSPFGLTMDSFFRFDHIATDFSLEPVFSDAETQKFFGSSDDTGAQNQDITDAEPDIYNGSVTIRGGVNDLNRLKYNQTSAAPTGTKRYNMGSVSTKPVGFVSYWLTNIADPDHVDAVAQGVFCNDVDYQVGNITQASDGIMEAVVTFTVKPSNVVTEVFETQADNVQVNV